MTTVWQISQMERTLADGGVVVCPLASYGN